jgi:hypothetical protein
MVRRVQSWPWSTIKTPFPAAGPLLVDARVRGDRLVGRWFRRDLEGQVFASGALSATRIAD